MKTIHEYRYETEDGVELIQSEPFYEEDGDNIAMDFIVDEFGIISYTRLRDIFGEEIIHNEEWFEIQHFIEDFIPIHLTVKHILTDEIYVIEVYINNDLFYWNNYDLNDNEEDKEDKKTYEDNQNLNWRQRHVYDLLLLLGKLKHELLMKPIFKYINEINHIKFINTMTRIIQINTNINTDCITSVINYL
jgi:hypothetical protein